MTPLTLTVDEFFCSPYAMASYVALTEKQVPFTLKTIGLHRKEQHDNNFVHSSLTARVPLLQHGTFTLSESSAICEYVDEQFASPNYPALYPKTPEARARVRQVQAWIRSDLMPLREQLSAEGVFYPTIHYHLDNAAATQRARDKLSRIATELLTQSNDTGYIAGEFSIADVDLSFMLMRLIANEISVVPQLRDYAQGIWQRASVQSWVQRERPAFQSY